MVRYVFLQLDPLSVCTRRNERSLMINAFIGITVRGVVAMQRLSNEDNSAALMRHIFWIFFGVIDIVCPLETVISLIKTYSKFPSLSNLSARLAQECEFFVHCKVGLWPLALHDAKLDTRSYVVVGVGERKKKSCFYLAKNNNTSRRDSTYIRLVSI